MMNRRQFAQCGAMALGAAAVAASLPMVVSAAPLTWTREIVFDYSFEYQNDPELSIGRIAMRHRSDGVAYYVTSKPGANPEVAKWTWNLFLTDESPVGPVSDSEFINECHRQLARLRGTVVSMDDGFRRAVQAGPLFQVSSATASSS